jgi:4-methyl-5(b-hydroxyethyl)-thiazole monophosphate biosynthesis
MKAPTVLIPIAHGSESLESVTLINVLRRAAFEVTVASVESELTVTGTRGVRLTADRRFIDTLEAHYELIAVPGGEKGAEALTRYMPLIEKLQAQSEAGRWFAAICAAPALTLAPHGLLDGRQATCHPAFKDRLPKYVDRPVVIDRCCVTSQGAGTALPFALKLVELLAGAGKSREVARQMVFE